MRSRKLSLFYLVASVGVLGFYGTRVCPLIESLAPAVIVAVFGAGFGLAALVKLALEPFFVDRVPALDRPPRQLVFDLSLYLLAGAGITLFDMLYFGFPAASGYKVSVGCLTLGTFAALDNTLARERAGYAEAAPRTHQAARVFPITRKLTLTLILLGGLTGVVVSLVVVHDMNYLIWSMSTGASENLRRVVFVDVGFVVGTILLLASRLIWSYSKNLNELFRFEIGALAEVEAGRLDSFVPVVTRDEFSLIATKTNQMIRGLRRARDDERRLFETTLAVSSELKLRPLLLRVMRTASEFVDADRSTLFLHDRKTDELWSMVAEGMDASEIRIPSGHGLAGHVFRSGETLNIEDAYSDPRFHADVDRTSGYRTRSILAMPVLDKEGRRIGVIQALNKREGSFSESDAERLRAFCAHAAIALVNAQLFDEVNDMKNYNESILKSLSDGVISLDEERRVVKANPAALELLKRDEGILGQPARELFAGPNAWVVESLDKVAARGLPVLSMDSGLELPDGSRASVNLNAVPLVNLKDEPIGAMLVIEDITTEKRVRTTMARYMPKEVAEQLLEEGGTQLGGEAREVSVLFSDIRGFTTLAEALGARETVSMLNGYFSVMVESVFQNRGILDKYIGDAIMAVFGAPFPSLRDADNAVLTAIDMMRGLALHNADRRRRGQDPIHIGVGIASGEVVVGNIGSEKRMDYTVIGDPVNLASRLEGANKLYDSGILIGEFTRQRLAGDFRTREVDRIRVKGKEHPVGIFEVMDYHTAESFPRLGETLAAYEKGLGAYRARDWKEARDCFEAALRLHATDGPSRLYRERCRHFAEQPPPDDWDGVWVMQAK